MNPETKIVRRVSLLAAAALLPLGLASAPAFARGDYVVHIDIPEIGNSPDGGGGPNHPFELSDIIGLDDEPTIAPIGPIAGDGMFPGPGQGLPGWNIDPFNYDGPGLAPDPHPAVVPGIGPIFDTNPVSSVPAPGGALLLGLGGVVFAKRRRR